LLKAVVFDMDGVIIDSEPMHAKAAILALKQYNVDVSMDYLQKFIGSTTYYMCQKMIEDFHIQATPDELWKANDDMKDKLLREEGHIVIPYIIDLMKNLHENGTKLIIASSSPAAAIEEVMESLQIKRYFQGYVSGSMVAHPKPAPDIFLLAAERLDVKPDECLVIEDSHHGVTAAAAARMACIGFINPNSGNQDLRKADMLVEGFDEVDYPFVNQVYQYSHMEPVSILITEHCIVKEIPLEDYDEMYRICQSPDNRQYIEGFSGNLDEEREKHKTYIENIYHFYGFGLWGIYLKSKQCLIGRCGIEFKQLDGENIYEIGYLLDKKYQGYGYAYEFVSEIIKYCYSELHIHRIVAVIDTDNDRSIHLAERVGMHRYGETFRNNHNCYKYEIIFS